MAFFFEETNRLVLPNWRSFSNTAKIGELNGSKKLLIDKSFNPDISDLIEGWLDFKTIGMAGDLIGTAILCNKENDPNVIDAATFLNENAKFATKELLNSADFILHKKRTDSKSILDTTSLDSFQERANLFFVYKKINELKQKLITNPRNSILWTELARHYSIIGQNDKAERSIKNALYLSPDNRFILRSMARFFTHFDKVDVAHDFIKKLQITKHDPWIMATEISLAMKRGRYSTFTKNAFNVVNSSNFHPFNISELNSSLGTLEMETSLKRSKKLFNDSLISPNDNSLAQAEWVSHQESNFIKINPSKFEIDNNYEAKARDSSENGAWENAIDYAKLWFLDMPFSRGAILFAGEIAANSLDDHEEAAYLYKAGLTSHPRDPQMVNNLIYSLCLKNNLIEAEKFLNVYPSIEKVDVQNRICFTATKGLYFFRKGFHDLGRQYYLEAMEIASNSENQKLANQAFVNYVREEVLALGNLDKELINKVNELRNTSKDLKIKKIINEIDELIMIK